MSQPKKYKDRKSIHEKLMARARQIEHAHHLQKSKLLQDIEVEYFAPALAGMVLAILLVMLGAVWVESLIFDSNCEIPEVSEEIIIEQPEIFESDLSISALDQNLNLQNLERPEVLSGLDILDLEDQIATQPKHDFFNLSPRELPTMRIFNTLNQIAIRAREGDHLLADALVQIEDLSKLYNTDIRVEVLNISEQNRAFFLNTHLNQIAKELSSTQGLELALEHIRADLESQFNFQKSQYENHLQEYNTAFDNLDENNAEIALQDLAQEKSEMESIAEQYDAYGGALETLLAYSDALEKKGQVIEDNFDALVAGVQVTFDQDVDLGLIN